MLYRGRRGRRVCCGREFAERRHGRARAAGADAGRLGWTSVPLTVKSTCPCRRRFDLTHHTLDNGLRVVLAPDRSAPVVGVAVLYDVGIRSEPEGRTGFAHLFEHLMFQGSANLEKLEHFRYVQSSRRHVQRQHPLRLHRTTSRRCRPTRSNAGCSSRPTACASPRITEENLANQLDVVKNEIRVNVMNRPYGGFPWIYLPAVLFDTFANSHNGYGGFEDLESATVDDASDFFERYYAPANAVLAVAGDLDVDETLALIEKHFGGITKRQAPKRPELRRAGADRRAARARTTTRTRRSRRSRSATACPTRSARSTS